MIGKKLLQKPILILGLLFFTIFVFDLKKRGFFYNPKTVATSCRSAIVMLEKRAPKNWDISCKNNEMLVEITEQRSDKQFIYKGLANSLSFISKNCLNESLERTNLVIVEYLTPKLDVRSYTSGKNLAALSRIKDPKTIAKFLQKFVKVKETIK